MALDGPGTLPRVAATKTLPVREKAAFTSRFNRWVRDEQDNNQTKAGEAIGISQAHVSALMRGERGPGLSFLILLRKKTSITIDEWLGLLPLEDELDARIRRQMDLRGVPQSPPAPPSSPRPQSRRRT